MPPFHKLMAIVVTSGLLFSCASGTSDGEATPMDTGLVFGGGDTRAIEPDLEQPDPCEGVVCNDDNACTVDECTAGKCSHTIKPSTECDDGNACTTQDLCTNEGLCNGIVSVICDDDNTCTEDECDSKSGCVFVPLKEGAPCSDGAPCSTGDKCVDGECRGTDKVCKDGGPCTISTGCDQGSGECQYQTAADDTPCTDGNACTANDRCVNGECMATGPTPCDDGNDCTDDSCNPKGGCVFVPNSGYCDDADKCTEDDKCVFATCKGALVNCNDGNQCTDDTCDAQLGCVNTTIEKPCEDGNPCSINDKCNNGDCESGPQKDCQDGNECTTEFCDLALGKCKFEYNSQVCNDGNLCTENDACKNGNCTGQPLDCDDGNLCTQVTCDPAVGCQFLNISKPCNDNNACTSQDKCSGGECVGSKVNCDDGNACTTDACTKQGGCSNVLNAIPCSDGNPCTVDDACVNGACQSGPNQCECKTTSDCFSKDDGNLCNGTLYCDKSAEPYTCQTDPQSVVECTSENDGPCEETLCNPMTGQCEAMPANDGLVCDDGDACTAGDVCQDGQCKAGEPQDCNDGNGCTDDACDAKTGDCKHTNNTDLCDDKSKCTKDDQCNAGQCIGADIDCGDSNPCIVTACNSATGCTSQPKGGECDDGDPCTQSDECKDGQCVGSGGLACDDNNPCTTDACTEDKGCEYVSNTLPCDDGDACTIGDLCLAKKCVSGLPKDCKDENVCTAGECQLDGTCKQVPVSNACDDGNACTLNTLCIDGGCAGGSELNCDDGNYCNGKESCDPAKGCVKGQPPGLDDAVECTLDSCSEEQNQVIHVVDHSKCDNGLFCDGEEKCTPTGCVAGTPPVISDGIECTDDVCSNETKKITHTPNHISCQDSSYCNGQEICTLTGCKNGSSPADDGIACTDDSCDETSKSVMHTPNAGLCDDQNACTVDTCVPATGCAYKPVDSDVGKICYAGPQGTAGIGECTTGLQFCNGGKLSEVCTGQVVPSKEICDGLDNDCDGQSDEGLLIEYFPDKDGDGVPVFGQVVQACDKPEGYAKKNGPWDCDDADKNNFPGNKEVCDGADNNCDGEGDPAKAIDYYPDGDGDGYAKDAQPLNTCVKPLGYAPKPEKWDCDDSNKMIYPGALELCGDDIDSDCDGNKEPPAGNTDIDGDGVTPCGGDCNDQVAQIGPHMTEVCGNGVDDDCDGVTDQADSDNDGIFACGDNADCNDLSVWVFPGAEEIIGDLVDNNCDGLVDESEVDDDGDGYSEADGDCDDEKPWIHPGAFDIPDSGDDEDCNGSQTTLANYLAVAVFVHATKGSDFLSGTKDFPVKTLNKALTLANAKGGVILATTGVFKEDAVTSIPIVGGYADDWSKPVGKTIIFGKLTTSSVVSRLIVDGPVKATAATLHQCHFKQTIFSASVPSVLNGNGQYKYFPIPQTWVRARLSCQSNSQELAILENGFDTFQANSLHPLSDAWIGLSDQAKEGVWRWTDGSSVSYSYWKGGKPKGAGDCGAQEAKSAGWFDAKCTAELPYVCEGGFQVIPTLLVESMVDGSIVAGRLYAHGSTLRNSLSVGAAKIVSSKVLVSESSCLWSAGTSHLRGSYVSATDGGCGGDSVMQGAWSFEGVDMSFNNATIIGYDGDQTVKFIQSRITHLGDSSIAMDLATVAIEDSQIAMAGSIVADELTSNRVEFVGATKDHSLLQVPVLSIKSTVVANSAGPAIKTTELTATHATIVGQGAKTVELTGANQILNLTNSIVRAPAKMTCLASDTMPAIGYMQSNLWSGCENLYCDKDGCRTQPLEIDFVTASKSKGSNIGGAPLFVDSNKGNFRLSPASPAVNSGFSTGNKDFSELDLDADRNPRVQGVGADIGAHEYCESPQCANISCPIHKSICSTVGVLQCGAYKGVSAVLVPCKTCYGGLCFSPIDTPVQ